MVPGFNHNVRHQNILFHVQTEDSGVSNPVVITHLFVGGNIVATRRSSYAKFVGKASLKEIVLAMMQEQHKEMMKDLVNGKIQAVQKLLGQNRTPQKEEVNIDTPVSKPAPSNIPFLDTSKAVDKTLDELILEFLEEEQQKKK